MKLDRSKFTEIKNKLVVTVERGKQGGAIQGSGGKKGYYRIIRNHVCETSENCKHYRI